MAKNRIGFTTDFNLIDSKVGIGTTNPLQSLHIRGNLLVAAGSSTGQHITQNAYELNSGTLSWEGSAGQLFSITNNLTSGSIFSVNDVSGIPSIDVDADGTIQLGPYGGNIGIGTTNPTNKLTVIGDTNIIGIVTASSFSGDAFNAYPFYSGITSSLFTSPTGVLNSVLTLPSTAGKRYIIHSINIANTARVQPQGAGATVGINTLAGAVTGIVTGGVGTGYTAGDVFVSMGTTDLLNRTRGLISIATTSFVGVGTTGDPAYAGITSAIGIVTAVSGGAIIGVALTYNGFGYTSAPVVIFQSPVGGGTTETGTSVLTFGEVTGAFLNVPGEGYKTPPNVSIASTSGIGVQITSEVDSDGKVIRLNLINRGYGYSRLNQFGNSEENEVYIDIPPLAKTEVGVDVEVDRFPIGGGTTVSSYIAFDVPIPVGGVLEILKQPAVMNPRDIIKIRGIDKDGSGLSGAIDVCISYEETNSNYIGFGTATPANVGLGTTVPNIGIISATTNPIMIQSIRLTNTEFVGDYDVSIKVITGAGQTFYLARNLMIPAFASVELCDTPKRLEVGSRILMDAETVGIDANEASTIDIQVSGRQIV
jgi:hypothetical protein